MVRKTKSSYDPNRKRIRKRTSIGVGVRSRPNNKHKRLSYKKYRGQGR